jgi:1-phosphofructokinase family hexose kinase
MILTLTLNPAVDQTVWLPTLKLGEVNRPRDTQLDPAGKGVNVSRMAHRLGWPTMAFGFLAGETGEIVERALEAERVHNHFCKVPGQTRINTTFIEDDTGRATNLYGPGPVVDRRELDRVEELLTFWLQAGRVLVLAGSVPRGLPVDAYGRLAALAKERGAKVIVDADGESLAAALPARPDLIKPNRGEAETLLGRSLVGRDAVVAGARELVGRGVRAVCISLGGEGSVLVEESGAFLVRPPRIERRSTVGSGDSLVAGIAVVLARGGSVLDGLRLGSAAGAATAASLGTSLGHATDVLRLLPEVEVLTL